MYTGIVRALRIAVIVMLAQCLLPHDVEAQEAEGSAGEPEWIDSHSWATTSPVVLEGDRYVFRSTQLCGWDTGGAYDILVLQVVGISPVQGGVHHERLVSQALIDSQKLMIGWTATETTADTETFLRSFECRELPTNLMTEPEELIVLMRFTMTDTTQLVEVFQGTRQISRNEFLWADILDRSNPARLYGRTRE